MRQYGRLS